MFNSLMPSLNIRSLPFVVFMGGFPSRLQNLSSGAIRPGGLLFLLDTLRSKFVPILMTLISQYAVFFRNFSSRFGISGYVEN